MKLQLKTKLVASFVVVIAVTGIIATGVGVHLIARGAVREAQGKVALDLNSAHQIYKEKLRWIEYVVASAGMREFAVKEALRDGDRQALLESLGKAMQRGELDFLTATDSKGRVVLRAQNPEVLGDSQAEDEIVAKVLLHSRPLAGTQILSGEQLSKESRKLAEQATLELIPTPKAKPTSETENTSGMVLKAAVPVVDDDTGDLVGVLYGGILLNRNYQIVDTIKDIVYRDVKYEGRDIGTATIFQRDLRISTNVKLADGMRAIGTRISSEVYDRVLGEGKTWIARAFVVKECYLTAYEPVKNINGEIIGILYVGMLAKKYDDLRRNALWNLLGVGSAGMVIAIVIAYVLANTITKPIRRLKQGIEALADGDFDLAVQVDTGDEVSDLANSFNRVRQELKDTYNKLQGKVEAADEGLKTAYGELQEKQEQLVNAEKLASLGSLAAGVAHEINNPLGTISMYAQMTLEELGEDQEECRENIEVVLKHANRTAQVVRNLLDFARGSDLAIGPVDLNTVLEDVIAITAHQAELQGVSVVKELARDLPVVLGDAEKLRQVFLNMVINALQAMSQDGRLTVTSVTTSDGRLVQVSIADTGCGIPEEHLKKIFDPFFTTKETGKGTGLGLSVSHGIVEQHNGSISVSSKPGEDTTFTITIPAAREEKRQ